MMNLKIWNGLGILLLMPHTAFATSTADDRNRDMALCVSAAKDALGEFNLDEKLLVKRCKCVRNERNGGLPSSISAWNKTGRNSAALTLVECSKQDITDFYVDMAFKTAIARMKKEGVSVEEIKRFSVCAGEGGYAELRRAAASAADKPNLDVTKFRQMYSRCEAAVK